MLVVFLKDGTLKCPLLGSRAVVCNPGGLPTLRPPLLRAPTLRAPPFGPPTPSGPTFSGFGPPTHQSPHPSGSPPLWAPTLRVPTLRPPFNPTHKQHNTQNVRGVSWSLLATVPKRKSRRSLDMNFLWNAEKGVWKVWKKSNGTEGKRRRVKRTTTTQRTDDHACME